MDVRASQRRRHVDATLEKQSNLLKGENGYPVDEIGWPSKLSVGNAALREKPWEPPSSPA